MIKVYMDVCCLNRPFDDQTQDRVRLETDAIVEIFRRVETGEWFWISSKAVQDEVDNDTSMERRAAVQEFVNLSGAVLILKPEQKKRTEELQRLGFHFYDALHLVFAEYAEVDIFLTTDDRLLRLAARVSKKLSVRTANPADWLQEVLAQEVTNG